MPDARLVTDHAPIAQFYVDVEFSITVRFCLCTAIDSQTSCWFVSSRGYARFNYMSHEAPTPQGARTLVDDDDDDDYTRQKQKKKKKNKT
jgi:hypothetical protein